MGRGGSGTGLAAYYAGFVSPELARKLSVAMAAHMSSTWGFSAIDEYADSRLWGGDVDSGPVIFGVSVGATGFALATTRMTGDRASFSHLYRTVSLFGMPANAGGSRRYATGGPIGNALLFAMLTARPVATPEPS